MAGHPVVGTAWVLHASGLTGERARLETEAGTMAAQVRGGVATVELGAAAAGRAVDGAEAAAAAGLDGAHDADARIWSAGVPQLMLRAPDAAAVRAARPDHDALDRLSARDGWLGVSVFALDGAPGGRLGADVRHFAPALGIPEDPVTGSAAAALGARLADAGHGESGVLEMVVRQTTAAGRGGGVAVRVESGGDGPARVRVGGRVVPLFEGRFVDR